MFVAVPVGGSLLLYLILAVLDALENRARNRMRSDVGTRRLVVERAVRRIDRQRVR